MLLQKIIVFRKNWSGNLDLLKISRVNRLRKDEKKPQDLKISEFPRKMY